MEFTFRRIVALLVMVWLHAGAMRCLAADNPNTPVVHVKYATGDADVDRMTRGVKLFLNNPDPTGLFPPSLRNLMFTRRAVDCISDVLVDSPKGANLIVLLQNGSANADTGKMLTDSGWIHGNSFSTKSGKKYDRYIRQSKDELHLFIPGKGELPVIILSEKLEVAPSGEIKNPTPAQPAVLPGAVAQTPAKMPEMTNTPIAESAAAAPVEAPGPVEINLGGSIDQIHTGAGGRFVAVHLKDSKEVILVDILGKKIVKKIPAEGDICFCMDRDKLILVLNNQQVIQRWSLATLTREKTVMLPDDRPVKRAVMGPSGAGPLLMWTDGGCKLLDVGTLKELHVDGTVQNSVGFGPWISADGMTICDWGWSGGPYSLMRLNDLTTTSISSRVVNVDTEDYNESWAMPSADGTQLLRHGATVYDASTDALVAQAAGPLKDAAVYPTEDPRFLLAVRGESEDNKTSSVAIVSAFDRRVLYTLHKMAPVTGGMIGTRSGRICTEPREHYLPAENTLYLIPNTDNKVVVYPMDLTAALKATGADYLYVISKPHTVLGAGQRFDYQIETLCSAAGVKFKVEQAPDGLTVFDAGVVSWKVPPSASGTKVPIVITVSDSAGDEIAHAIELHVLDASQGKPDPGNSVAHANPNSKGIKPEANSPAPAAPKKVPDDPELKALADKIAKAFAKDLNDDNATDGDYSIHFTLDVGSAVRKSADSGRMILNIREDRLALQGGGFIDFVSHVDAGLKKVDGMWTCTHAQSTLDYATTSHGPIDVPFKQHDVTRSIRGLLDDAQNEPKTPPPVQNKEPTHRA